MELKERNRFLVSYRKLNLQIRQLSYLRRTSPKGTNSARIKEQEKVLLHLLNPKILFSTKKLVVSDAHYEYRYINKLLASAMYDFTYKVALNAVKAR